MLLVVACSRTSRVAANPSDEAANSRKPESTVTLDGIVYQQKELGFMDRSSQGGAIEVYMLSGKAARFEVMLFAERGKRFLSADLRDPLHIKLQDEQFAYDRSIYDEGDVLIANHAMIEYLLEDGRLFEAADHSEVFGDKARVLALYRDARSVVDSSIK
jgi:hypothetical protein